MGAAIPCEIPADATCTIPDTAAAGAIAGAAEAAAAAGAAPIVGALATGAAPVAPVKADAPPGEGRATNGDAIGYGKECKARLVKILDPGAEPEEGGKEDQGEAHHKSLHEKEEDAECSQVSCAGAHGLRPNDANCRTRYACTS